MSELYTLTVDGFPPGHFTIHSFSGRETISEPYAFDLVVTSDATGDEEVERLALGRRAVFSWSFGMAPRAFYGVLAAVGLREIHEAEPRSARYCLRLVPRLWLLRRKRRSRIFQQMRVPEIVDAVLGEVGIATRWALGREHPVRAYCTQYEESDYRFISRLLAESGIYFFFMEGPLEGDGAAKTSLIPGDSLVLGDDATGYLTIGEDAREAAPQRSVLPSLHFFSMQQTSVAEIDKITSFALHTSVRATTATFQDYDPERPMARLTSSAGSTAPFPGEDGGETDVSAASAMGLEVYEHHGPFLFPTWSFAQEEAPRMLRQKRRRAQVARGESGCPDLAPGHRFTLEGHPAAHVNRDQVVIAVEHRGEARPTPESAMRTYWNCFSCAPAEVVYVPPRPKRRSVQVALTATVAGPSGEEIHVDALGQIKVQFHWDRQGSYDERSSCWIRTMHPWSGAGWGAQFIPRVGMEVVVVFEGGDTDKPMVLGALYNGTHPPPFALPSEKTRSGFRTQSTPGGGGSNELSFEDAAANEQIYLHAQRDLDAVVERNHTRLVRGDERVQVLGSRTDQVDGNANARVAGNDEAQITGDRSTRIEGNRLDVVSGNADERVSGMLVTRVEGKERREVQESADLAYADDLTTRVEGCMTTLVGKADRKRSWLTHAEGTAKLSSLESTEVSSEAELVLRVGKSWIRITDDAIELVSPGISVRGAGAGLSVDDAGLSITSKEDGLVLVDKKLVIRTKDGASVSMGEEVKIDGKKILLNSPEQAKDEPPPEPEPPTAIELVDDQGKPLAYQRFLVTLDDESEVSGMTDAEGKAELSLKSGGKVSFPELTMSEDQGGVREVRPYIVRQGDYLAKLAFVHAFKADDVWDDPKNEDLKKSRQDPNVLAPGDVIHIPANTEATLELVKGTTNRYRAASSLISFTIVMTQDGIPLKNEPYLLFGLGAEDGEPREGTTDPDGKVTLSAPPWVTEVTVVFHQKGHLALPVFIGHMDPISSVSGWRKRLDHMGFYGWVVDPYRSDGEDIETRDREAVLAFQSVQGLACTGIMDEQTQKALLVAHGW